MQKYTLKVKRPQDWQEIHNLLCQESHCDCIPDRIVCCSDDKAHSPTRSTYELTDNEVEELKKHEKIEWIELSPSDNIDSYPKPIPNATRFSSSVKIYRDLDFNAPPLTNPTNAELNRISWASKRLELQDNTTFWSTTGNPPTQTGNLTYTKTGANVDIVIQDDGVLQYHPEFLKSDGTSRVRDIVLDGPYYIDPSYFVTNGYTVTKPDGRTGITEASAKNWWSNSSNRSPGFSTIGTVSIPSLYTESNALGSSLDGSNTISDGHGTAVAGLSAGKNMGLSFEANIWNISVIVSSTNLSVEASHDLIKIWHQNKPTNPSTGVKNPTVVNGSWGYLAGFFTNSTVQYKFRGLTGTFVGSDSVSNQITAMKEGLVNQINGAYKSWSTSSRSNSTETAGNELLDSGVIFVASAGNCNQRLGIGAGDPDKLNYMSDSFFGTTDPRPEFPSGTVPCNHRDWLHPQGIGYDSINDFHPVICVGAMDEYIESNSKERKASYSSNGSGIDIWSPADETLAPGKNGSPTYATYQRVDDNRFYDSRFSGTSAAAPVISGLIALYMEENPTATSAQVKSWLNVTGSTLLTANEYLDPISDDTTTSYWTGLYNMRGAPKKIAYNPYTDGSTPANFQAYPNKTYVYEGDDIIITVNTNSSNDGTYYYSIEAEPSSNIQPGDFNIGSLSGSFSIINGIGTVQLTLSDDSLQESNEIFRFRIRETSITGNIIATTEYITVSDQPSASTELSQYQVPLRIYLKF